MYTRAAQEPDQPLTHRVSEVWEVPSPAFPLESWESFREQTLMCPSGCRCHGDGGGPGILSS